MIDYRCKDCGKDILGKVRIQNNRQGYVKCLQCGLGIGTPKMNRNRIVRRVSGRIEEGK